MYLFLIRDLLGVALVTTSFMTLFTALGKIWYLFGAAVLLEKHSIFVNIHGVFLL